MIARSGIGDEARDVQRRVRAAQAGDVAAFDELVDLYADRILRFVRARVPEADAEDIAQRIFLRVIEAIPGYQDRGIPFGAWLFRIARNAVIDAARARRDDLSLETADVHESPLPGPAETFLIAAGNAALRRALAALPDDQRDVITLRFFGDLSTREIAASLGKHEGAVRVLQFRALRALRRRLEPRFDQAIDHADVRPAESWRPRHEAFGIGDA